ncbi:MAG: hypothetical protein ACOYL8_04685 [Patescibacteria group bacterium]
MNKKIIPIIISLIVAPVAIFAAVNNGTIDVNNSIAWGEKLGWINFAPVSSSSYNGLKITDTEVTGYAWSRQYGWINFAPTNGGVTNNCSGTLGGYAWSSQLGWLNLSGAAIDNNGRLIGITSTDGSDAGRINFNCTNCLVKTDWRPCAVRPAVCGNGITETGEACDNGTNNGACSKTCSSSCQLNSCNSVGGGGGGINPPPVIPPATSTNPTTSTSQIIPDNPVSTSTPIDSIESSWYVNIVRRSDIARDGLIDLLDFNSLMVNWGRSGINKADTNLDGMVDLLDFNSLMIHWGKKEY